MPRGIDDERQLARLLWKKGFAVVRALASGLELEITLAEALQKGVDLTTLIKDSRQTKLLS